MGIVSDFRWIFGVRGEVGKDNAPDISGKACGVRGTGRGSEANGASDGETTLHWLQKDP